MRVKTKTHKAIMIGFVTVSIIGILILLRMALVMGASTYFNAQSHKDGNQPEDTAGYYLVQAMTGDFMEPYIAYYNAGTSFALSNQPEIAERLLDKALLKVDNDYNECYVRNNLAKVQEQLGDYNMISDRVSTAETYYNKAVTTIQESPMVCFPPPPSGSGGDGDPQEGEGGEPQEGEPQEDKDGEPQEGEESKDGNPLTPQDKKPEDPENGENMKETEERSKEKEDKAKEAQGKSGDGKDQVEEEMDQSKSEAENQEDTDKQQQNKTPQQVDKPW